MRRIIRFLADKPIIFNILRRIIEFNYISVKKVIKNEFSLDHENEKNFTGERILDVPCGTGEFCMLFSPNSYYGLDISKKYIEYAQKKYAQRFFCSDAKQSGFDNDYFDKILTLGFLHHLDDSSASLVLKEVKRILKPSGKLLLIEDVPTRSTRSIFFKVLQGLDIGQYIRTDAQYIAIAAKDFIVEKYYPLTSGFWDYSVYVLSPKK